MDPLPRGWDGSWTIVSLRFGAGQRTDRERVIAALHAFLTLELLSHPADFAPGFSSLLMTLRRVPGVFEEAFRPHRLRVARAADCLICRPTTTEFAASSAEALDVALDQALARLGDA